MADAGSASSASDPGNAVAPCPGQPPATRLLSASVTMDEAEAAIKQLGADAARTIANGAAEAMAFTGRLFTAVAQFDAEHDRIVTKLGGGLQAATAVPEFLAGVALMGGGGAGTATGAGAPVGVPTMLFGGALASNAIDNYQAGIRTALSGTAEKTALSEGVGVLAKAGGASPKLAGQVADVVNAGQGLVGPGMALVQGGRKLVGSILQKGPGATAKSIVRIEDPDVFKTIANNPAAHTRYEMGTYAWTTDKAGRTIEASGTVSLTKAGRDTALQGAIGKEGASTDVGFHLVGDRFGGPTNRLNVVAANGKPLGDGIPNLNQGPYKKFENSIAKLAADPANKVDMRVKLGYSAKNATTRPDTITAAYRNNGGDWIEKEFVNRR